MAKLTGLSGTSDDTVSLLTQYTTTTPVTPTTGVTLFDRQRARHLPASIGPSGQDTILQPNLFSNKISLAVAQNSVVNLVNTLGLATTVYGTSAAVTVAANNFYVGRERTRNTSAATAQAICGWRTSNAKVYTSLTANDGGFFVVIRFGLFATAATNKVFVGMSTTTTLALTGEPSALLNCFGVAADSAQNTFRFMNSAGTVGASVDLGASFPVTPAATNFYELSLFSPSGGGQTVSYCFRRLNDGATAFGTVTTNLPVNNTLLFAHASSGNGATAAAVAMDIQHIYIETDN